MPIINPTNEFYSLGVQKRFSKPIEFGQAIYGWSQFGDDNEKSGVYHRRILRGNFWTKTNKIKKGIGYCKMKYYYTSNPQTESQQANRQKLANAVSAWQNLTSLQKSSYNKRAIGENKSGYNIFISEWVKSH